MVLTIKSRRAAPTMGEVSAVRPDKLPGYVLKSCEAGRVRPESHGQRGNPPKVSTTGKVHEGPPTRLFSKHTQRTVWRLSGGLLMRARAVRRGRTWVC